MNKKALGTKIKYIGWETLCTYATLEQNTSKHFEQLTLHSKTSLAVQRVHVCVVVI